MAAESLSGHQALPVPPTSQIQEGKGFFEIRKEKGQFPYLPEKPTTGHYFPVQSKGHARADTPAFPYTHPSQPQLLLWVPKLKWSALVMCQTWTQHPI